MGLRRWLRDRAVTGARVLLVEAPGWWQVRAGVERELRERGWSVALSPADADALVVVGVPGEQLRDVVERVWDQLPGPRARCEVAEGPAGAGLDAVARVLVDEDHQRSDAQDRALEPAADEGSGDMDMDMDMDMGGDDSGDMDMDMGDMDMAPDGIDLAGGFEGDRDGLEMDVLHVPLGPVLAHWPAGLVLRCTLSGDVAVEVDVETLDAAAAPAPAALSEVALIGAQRCDQAARLLALAGSADHATGLRRVRDDLLAGASPEDVHPRLAREARRVARSRLLRWSLRDLGRIDDEAAAGLGLPESCRGDVHDRLLAMLDAASGALAGTVVSAGSAAAAARAALPSLVTGYELAALRLIVASLPLDPEESVVSAGGPVHGEAAA